MDQLGPSGYVHRSYDDIKAQYPDKNILTISGIVPSDFITDTINEFLVQSGTDYVVFFQTYTEEQRAIYVHANDHQKTNERKQAIYELLDSVDIMIMDRNNYFELARKGCFEPWSSYLPTEEGMKLYKSMPENNWKSCDVDGEIYGVNGRSDFIYGPPSYIVNKDIMNKYNLTIEDLNKPIYELEDILKLVAEGEKENTVFRVIVADLCICLNLSEASLGYLDSTAVSLYNDKTKKAGSVLDEAENLRWLKALWKYANQDFIGKKSKQLKNFFIAIDPNTSLPYMIPDYMLLYNKDGELADSDDVVEIVLDKHYNGCLSWNNYLMYANCIPVASKYKDEAFNFLMRLYTDPYLTNLLSYGIENKTYVMIDGKVDWPDIYYPEYGNTYISYSRSYEYADKKERYWKLNEELAYVYYDFIFDPTNVKDELEKTNQVMDKVSDILSGNVTDFDVFIDNIRRQLDDSGLTKLLDEVNRQRDDWINSKKLAEEETE
mgnify:CR=1 FL=1